MVASRHQLKTQFAAANINKPDRIQSNQLDNILIWAIIETSGENSPARSKFYLTSYTAHDSIYLKPNQVTINLAAHTDT